MIARTLAQIAQITGGALGAGADQATIVDGPVVIDSRQAGAGSLFVAFDGEQVDGHDFVDRAFEAGAVAALVTKPVAQPHILVADATEALTRLATEVVAGERDHLCVIAITGSAGKTSVKDLVRGILEATAATVAPLGSFNNEIGVPLTVLSITEETRYLVVEMGARAVGHIAHLCRIVPPDVAVVVNVGSAHAGEFGGPENTARAKSEIVSGLRPGGIAVLNVDDPQVAAMAPLSPGRVVRVSEADEAADVRWSIESLDADGRPTIAVRGVGFTHHLDLGLIGRHQGGNAALALAAALAAGAGVEASVTALAAITTLSPMRMERTVRSDGVVVINDAYNANPESMAAALDALAGIAGTHGIAILGGMLELGDSSVAAHRRVGELARQAGVSHVVAVGEIARPIADGAADIGVWVPDFVSAVSTISRWLSPDSVVLLKASRGERLSWNFSSLTDV